MEAAGTSKHLVPHKIHDVIFRKKPVYEILLAGPNIICPTEFAIERNCLRNISS
jgi:hypothetical protein